VDAFDIALRQPARDHDGVLLGVFEAKNFADRSAARPS
jgi:hypothetical protein